MCQCYWVKDTQPPIIGVTRVTGLETRSLRENPTLCTQLTNLISIHNKQNYTTHWKCFCSALQPTTMYYIMYGMYILLLLLAGNRSRILFRWGSRRREKEGKRKKIQKVKPFFLRRRLQLFNNKDIT